MEVKKKRKNYFSNQGNDQKRKKRLSIECGMRGFLCTCNFREKDCVREAYNLLDEYTDKYYDSNQKQCDTLGDESKLENKNENEEQVKASKVNETRQEEVQLSNKSECNDAEDIEKKEIESKEKRDNSNCNINDVNDDDEEDISTALNKELNELKAETGKPLSQKKFQVVDTGVTNVVFIKSTVPDPLELVTAIIKDLHETKKQKARYLLRLLPIQIVCKAYLDDIRSKADPLFDKYFVKEPKTFAIVFNRHSNSNLNRNDVIEDLAKIISRKNPGNKANLKNPDIAVVVLVVRAVCLISIAPQYFTYKKYNLLEICNQK